MTEQERALALTYALALMRDRLSFETNANAAMIQRHIYALIELVADVQGSASLGAISAADCAVDPQAEGRERGLRATQDLPPALPPPVEPPPQDGRPPELRHNPLREQK
jgi:hypothetical protein